MTEAFERLAETLTDVRRHAASGAVAGVSWLYLHHPIQPRQRELLALAGGPPASSTAARFDVELGGVPVIACVRAAVHAVYVVAKIAWLRLWFSRARRALARRRFDVVLKTWCYGLTKPADARDFYYGDLQARLTERGMATLLVCGDGHDGRDWASFAREQFETGALARIPELCLVSPLAPLRVVAEAVAGAVRLARVERRSGDPVLRRAAALARRDCFGRYAVRVALYRSIGSTIASRWRPRAVVTLYEGLGWEQCLWSGVKASHPRTLIAGYQHTAVFRHNLAMLRPPPPGDGTPTPDLVLCTGPGTQALLAAAHRKHGTRFVVLGSVRRHADERFEAGPRPGRRTVLVIPEGEPGEAILMFEFVARAAAQRLDHRFILRCHPKLPYETIRHRLASDPLAAGKVTLSEHPIGDDFAQASVVLYRGSSAVLSAVLHGLKPLYLRQPAAADMDPLFELTSWRETTSSADDFSRRLAEYAATDVGALVPSWRQAVDYAEDYFAPFGSAGVESLLAAINGRRE